MPEFAPGLPDKRKFTPIPSAKHSEWTVNIQEHNAKRAGKHYDLRFNPPGTNISLSWATRKLPEPGEKTLAIRQPDHTKDYMGFSGTIPEGYGAGKVDSLLLDKVDILKAEKDKIEFNLYRGKNVDKYILLNKPDTDEWLFYNYTPTSKSKAYTDVPKSKTSYKSIKPEDVLISPSDDAEVWSPKLDGAHNLVILRPDKRPDVFSYRRSKKRGEGFLDHTDKTKLRSITSPKTLRDTVLRSELYIPGGKSEDTARILNSNTFRARELQRQSGPLEVAIFDVVKFKGKNVENLPFKDKIPMLKEVSKEIPQLKLPPMAYTDSEKRELLESVLSGRNPLTDEGIVIYKMNSSVPLKVKKTDDHDVKIVDTFPAAPGSKYEGQAIGGFIAEDPATKKRFRIGTGLSDSLRKDAYDNPDSYIGMWAQVKSQEVFKSGKHRAPVFLNLRADNI